MHRKVAVAIAAALALTVASCGGSETTTLNRAALVRRVETVCREALAASARQARATRTPDPIKMLQVSQKLLVERLDGLAGSGDAKADFDTYKEGVRTRLSLIEKVAAGSRAERPRLIRSVQKEAEVAGRRLEGAARSLGIRSCS